MIKTIVFDLGGVLMQHNMPGCIAKFKALLGDNFPKLGLQANGEPVDAPISVMRDYEIGGASTEDFVAALLPYCKAGTTEADILDAWVTMHAGIPAERIAAVEALSKQYPLYLLSNNNEAHWQDVNLHYPALVALFQRHFLSHELHYGKPDPRIFEAADKAIAADCAQRGETYNPAETMFVDDLEANCQAARKHGWQACLSLEALSEFTGRAALGLFE